MIAIQQFCRLSASCRVIKDHKK